MERSAASARSVWAALRWIVWGKCLVVVIIVVAASHEDASEPPATLGLIVVEGSQTIGGRPIREEHAPEERAGAYYLEKDRNH